jgi:hypothetical protein
MEGHAFFGVTIRVWTVLQLVLKDPNYCCVERYGQLQGKRVGVSRFKNPNQKIFMAVLTI